MYPLKIFVIAGEVSGDILGGAILSALEKQTTRTVQIMGIGAEKIKQAGLKTSLIPMHDLAVMGITEIVPRIPFFLRAIHKTVTAIEGFKPDIVLTIDAPDFSFRVQKKLRDRGRLRGCKQIHVVAPSVWAWRPGRAEKIAQFLDGLVCFFPFEPPYFTKYNLDSISMGHPAIDAPVATANPVPLRAALNINPPTKTVGLYLGSRAGVIARHADTFIAAVNQTAQLTPNLCVLIPTFPEYVDMVRAACAQLTVPYHIITDPLLKPPAMRACDAALAVSGTVGLELSIADVPHVVGYKTSTLTWLIARTLVTTEFAHLANIVLGRLVVPECIQNACNPDTLSANLSTLLTDAGAAKKQRTAFHDVRRAIGQDAAQKPADTAAAFILGKIGEAVIPVKTEVRQ